MLLNCFWPACVTSLFPLFPLMAWMQQEWPEGNIIIKNKTWSPPWRFCPSCPFVALILSKPIDRYVSKDCTWNLCFTFDPWKQCLIAHKSHPFLSVYPINRWLYQISFLACIHEARVTEHLYFNQTFETLEHAVVAWKTLLHGCVSMWCVCFWGKISLVHPRMVKQFSKLPSPFSNVWSPQGWVCWGNIRSCVLFLRWRINDDEKCGCGWMGRDITTYQ